MPVQAVHAARAHFFPHFNRGLDRLPDRRRPDRCTYRVRELLWLELLMLLTGVGSRHAMIRSSATTGLALTLAQLAGLPTPPATAPHPDTAYVFLQALPPAALEAALAAQIKPLFRQRCWEDFRFDGEWLVGIDATWLRTYAHAHCPHCLRQRHGDGQLTCAHAVLEAKLLLRNGLVVPLASVPIRNDDPAATKQDCELKALPRLAALLKRRYPRLPICLTLDSLYAVTPVLDLCAQYRWSYVTVFKAGRAPAFFAQALAAAAQGPHQQTVLPDGRRQDFTWACNLDYLGRRAHFIRCLETNPKTATTSCWCWLTDHRPDPRMAPFIANEGGRPRWHLEENFHVLKHGPSQQHHDFGSQGHAGYNTWLVAQFAQLLLHLVAYTDVLRPVSGGAVRTLRQAYGTVRGFVAALLLSVQRDAARLATPPDALRLHFFHDTT